MSAKTRTALRSRVGFATSVLIFLTYWLVAAETSHAQYWTYTVRPGDNLWTISEQYLADMRYWRPLQRLNDVARPREIPPGSTLRLPVRWLRIQPAEVLVLAVRGSAEAVDGLTGTTGAVTLGMTLKAADQLRTAADSSVTLQFADGSRFIVEDETRLALDTVSAFGATGMVDTRIRLLEGRLDARTAPNAGDATRFEVWTEAAVTAVRGTEYRVGLEAGSRLGRAEALAGEVEVTAAGRSRRLAAGFGAITRIGEAPSRPIPLLDAPDVSVLPPVLTRSPLQLELPALAGAVGYRLQVASDAVFDAVLFDRSYAAPQLTGPDLPDGDYVLRVRGIDGQGLEGRDAYHRFTLDARPEPPILMTPDQDATVRDKAPRFNWTEPQEAEAFHFQLSTDPDFATLLLDRPGYHGTELEADQALEPGDFHWRVATVGPGGDIGPFSDAQTFTLRPAPDSPELEEPAYDEETLVLRWRAGLTGQRYHVQLARDPAFRELTYDETVDEARIEIPRPLPGRYYLRVRTIDVDGYVPEFGPWQQLDVPPASFWPLLIPPVFLLVAFLL